MISDWNGEPGGSHSLGLTFGGLLAAKRRLGKLREVLPKLQNPEDEGSRIAVALMEKRLRSLVRYLLRRVDRFYPYLSPAFRRAKGGAA
jgi:hypothetical protein